MASEDSFERANEKRRVVDSQRRTLSGVLILYSITLLVACGVLLCQRLPEPLFWGSFVFWRLALTAIGIVALAVSYDFLARTCSTCRAQSAGAIVFLIVYELWCLIVAGFVVHDIINCAAQVWCAGSGPNMPNGYYLTWVIAFILMIILQLVIVLLMARMRSKIASMGACVTDCGEKRRGFADMPFTGADVTHVHGYARDPALVFEDEMLSALNGGKRV